MTGSDKSLHQQQNNPPPAKRLARSFIHYFFTAVNFFAFIHAVAMQELHVIAVAMHAKSNYYAVTTI